jgi:hypothetical protein
VPEIRPFLTAEWRHLVMANWEVDPAVLEPFVPAGTTLDAHEGITYASVVAFRFLNTKVLGVPVPFHRNFEEINLRFYVRREDASGVKRGVVFIREVVPKHAIALVARWAYNEPYVALPTRSMIDEEAGRYEYSWRLPSGWARLTAATMPDARYPTPDSVEAFISEHYFGYNRQRDGSTLEYRVEHLQWRVWPAASHEFSCDVAALYGEAFVPFLNRPPASVFVADGSAVSVHPGRDLPQLT